MADHADPECVFCKIVAGDAPATILEKWPDTIAIAPRNPVTLGHALIIPKAHVMSFRSDPVTTGLVAARAAQFVADWVDGAANLITSAGSTATQTVHHLHWHVVPRRSGDGLHLPWTLQGADVEEGRTWYRAVNPDTGRLIAESSDGAEVDRVSAGRPRRLERLPTRIVRGPWQPWNPAS